MKDGDLIARRAGPLQCRQCRFDLPQAGHAGGEDNRLSVTTDVAQIRQIGDLSGRNLEAVEPEAHQQIDALHVKSGREKLDPLRLAMGNQFIMHVPRQLEPAKHRVLGFAGVRGLDLVVGLARLRSYQPIGAEGLKLDAVSARICGNLDQLTRHGEIAIMIHARFGNDQGLQVDLLRGGLEVPASQSASTPCAMPIKQRSPMLTHCRTVQLLPTKVPSPIRTPPLITAAVAI